MIDTFLEELDQRLRVPARVRRRIVAEAHDHLVESVDRRVASGAQRADAESAAISSFGDPAVVAMQFGAAWQTRAMRRVPAVTGAAGVVLAAGFLLAAATQPAPADRAQVTHVSVAVPFNVGAVAFQIAVVAGILGLIRTASRWRLIEASATDRRLVTTSGRCCGVALAATAICWSIALLDDGRASGDARWSTLSIGIVVMAGGALLGVIGVLVVGRLDADEAAAPGVPTNAGLLGLGERLLGWELGRPWPSCIAVAMLAGTGAAINAETAMPGSLAWGAVEVVVVVAAFVALGGPLGLRHPAEQP